MHYAFDLWMTRSYPDIHFARYADEVIIFRPRRAKNRWGKYFVSFLPAISDKAANAIRETIREWRLAATRNNQTLEEIAGLVNPSVRGWVNYYGRFYRSALTPVLRHLADRDSTSDWIIRAG